MDFIIYHSKDLDGKASGAIAQLYFQKDNPKLIGYHYNEPLDLKQFEGKDVLMVDVTLSVESIIQLAQTTKSFTLVDHHISFFENFKTYFGVDDIENQTNILPIREFTGLISHITHANMNYYYSEKLAACEVMLQLFTVGNETTQKNVRLLGQYDSWRNTDEKKFTTDMQWDFVMDHQFGFRLAETIGEVQTFLLTEHNLHIQNGYHILRYQDVINKTAMQRSFVFQLKQNGLRFLACEGVQFNSRAFESAYNPEFHDVMMAFNYDGQTQMWNFSMYSTINVNILEIAKQFGGGGHKQACGFQLPFDQVRFDKENGIVFGSSIIMIDIASLPKDVDVVDFIKTWDENIKGNMVMLSPKANEVVNTPAPAPPTEEVKPDIIAGLSDDNDLEGIGSTAEKIMPETKATVKPKAKSNGIAKK